MKTTADLTLEDCYCKVISKAADIAKSKPKDNATLTPRSIGIKLLQLPGQAIEVINMELYKKEDSTIFLPQIICGTLSERDKKELSKYNALIQRNKRKSYGFKTLLPLPLAGKITPRSNIISPLPKSKKK